MLYRHSPWFYVRYELGYLALMWTAILGLWLGGWRGVGDPGVYAWALAPLAVYLHVLANVVVHNCCHQNLPRKINRPVAELLGVLVLVRYAAWEILHRRHHRYPDDPERDPHPCQPSFLRFLFVTMFVNLERQLHAIRVELHGLWRGEKLRTILTLTTDVSTTLAWAVVLGWPVFLMIFLPAQVLGWIVVAHFNWVTHNGPDKNRQYAPRDLDSGPYWLANRMLFGLYMHARHHRRAGVFNPLR